MKALVIHAAKDLRLEDIPASEPGHDEVVVDISAGGICGSDLHYYNHGGLGAIQLREPMILGHEVAGTVTKTGKDVQGLTVGDLVAVSPSRPCGCCEYCLQGQHNHCLNMRFYGSAMPFPHIQGAFRQQLTALRSQCVVATSISAAEAAMAEPFAVVLHAAGRAGKLMGKRALVTGCGPIGVLSVIALRLAGAAEIVATDLADNALSVATRCGADTTVNVSRDVGALDSYQAGKGYFDVVFECSGSVPALNSAIQCAKPRSVIMQLGLGGDMTVPMLQLTAKEIDLRGSFRFHQEFELAVRLMDSGRVDLKPLITHSFSLDEAEAAFKIANDRNVSMKAQIQFA